MSQNKTPASLPADASVHRDSSGKIKEISFRNDKFFSVYEVGVRVRELTDQFHFLEKSAKGNTNPATQKILYQELKMLQTWIKELNQVYYFFKESSR